MAEGWNDVVVNSWRELLDAFEPLVAGYRTPPTYVFRGQPDVEMRLEPSLLRLLRGVSDPQEARELEGLLGEEFIGQASLFPETRLVVAQLHRSVERWSFMQHHGCPTRLLDWTASAFVAAYFAVRSRPMKDGAVYAVAPAVLDEDFEEEHPGAPEIDEAPLLAGTLPERVKFLWPAVRSRRVVAQQGHFSVNTSLLGAHDGPILKACARRNSTGLLQRRVIIPSPWKLPFLQGLRAMNIAPHALFPTLDGLGESLRDVARLRIGEILSAGEASS